MKDQYFGDINDYRKYGLLRAISGAGDLNLMIAWMLTSDDGGMDGKFTSYLEYPDKWGHHDLELFQTIKKLLAGGRKRQVSLIEKTNLFEKVDYFSVLVPDAASDRSAWFNLLNQKS